MDLKPLFDSLYAETPKLKNEKLGQWLAYIPGLAHCYAGYPAYGLAAFALNAAMLGFGVWQVLERCYLTAWIGGAGMLSITYPGALHSAELFLTSSLGHPKIFVKEFFNGFMAFHNHCSGQ